MAVLKNVFDGAQLLAAGIIGYIVGSFGWSAVTGIVGGAIAAFGVGVPSATLIALSPVAGLATAGFFANWAHS